MRTVIAALAVILSAGVASAATTRKVPQDYETIQSAVDDAEDGDTILVSKRPDGKPWDEKVYSSKSLKFIGKKVTWDGHDAEGNAGTCLTVANEGPLDGVVVQGFNFRNGSGHVYVAGNHTLIQSCTFRGAYSYAVTLGGTGAVVQKCSFRGNGRAVSSEGEGTIVQRNTATGHTDGGIYLYGSQAVVLGNRVSRSGNATGIYVNGPGATVSGNTVSDAGSGLQVSGDDALVERNRVSRCSGAETGIDVYGRGAEILGNQVSVVDGTGIYLYQSESSSENASLVEGNLVRWVSSVGIYSYGFTATLRGNSVSHCNSSGIELYHYANDSGCVVEGNTVADSFGFGVYTSGGGFVVSGNQVRNVYNDGIYCSANEYAGTTEVSGNRVQGFFGEGIYLDVNYSGFEVTGNEVSDGQGHSDGIYVYAYFGTGGSVNGNRVGGATGDGIHVYAYGNSGGTNVLDNQVTDSGTRSDTGLYFYGSGASIQGNSVSGQIDRGIAVYGGPNIVHGNTLEGCSRGGLLVAGDGVTVTGNTGKTGDGEGFVNYGFGTVFTGNTFLGFRLDVASSGSFATEDIDAVNVFETGGASTYPQLNGE